MKQKLITILFLILSALVSDANSEQSDSIDLLNQIGSLSSIMGLLITVLIAIIGYVINNKIKEIQRDIQFDVRIKSLIKQLEKSKSSYPKYLENYSGSIKNIRFEISQTEVILKNIKIKIKGTEKKSVNNLLKQIQRMKLGKFINEDDRSIGLWITITKIFNDRFEISENDLWDFYTELSAMQTQLENLIEDKNIKQYA